MRKLRGIRGVTSVRPVERASYESSELVAGRDARQQTRAHLCRCRRLHTHCWLQWEAAHESSGRIVQTTTERSTLWNTADLNGTARCGERMDCAEECLHLGVGQYASLACRRQESGVESSGGGGEKAAASTRCCCSVMCRADARGRWGGDGRHTRRDRACTRGGQHKLLQRTREQRDRSEEYDYYASASSAAARHFPKKIVDLIV